MYPADHLCFVKTIPINGGFVDDDEDNDIDDMLGFDEDHVLEKDEDRSNTKFVFFDFESMFVDNEHVPNVCVAQWRCEICLAGEKEGIPRDDSYQMIDSQEANAQNKDIEYPKDKCRCGQIREKIFSGHNTKTEICDWLFMDHHQDSIIISHNGKCYDNIFCLEYLLKTKGLLPDIIFTGIKLVMSISLPAMNFRIIDSINFLAKPLAQFPSTFGLTELTKGYLPYWYNIPEFQRYIGPLPPKDSYGMKTMKPENKEQFEKRYDEEKSNGFVFNIQQALLHYCRSDVQILHEGFHYLGKNRGIELQHYCTGREVRVAGFKVDAYHE